MSCLVLKMLCSWLTKISWRHATFFVVLSAAGDNDDMVLNRCLPELMPVRSEMQALRLIGLGESEMEETLKRTENGEQHVSFKADLHKPGAPDPDKLPKSYLDLIICAIAAISEYIKSSDVPTNCKLVEVLKQS